MGSGSDRKQPAQIPGDPPAEAGAPDGWVTVCLSLGCNLGECLASLAEAVRRLNRRDGIRVIRVSSVYLTEPVGNPDQPDFLNIALMMKTRLNPRALLEAVRAVETALGGREGRTPGGPRTMDIDILLYDNLKSDDPELTVPHPRMLERAFVLAPLAEIAPKAKLPQGGTVAGALENLYDSHRVRRTGALQF